MKPRNATFCVRFEGEVVAWLHDEARRELCSVTQVVRALVGAEYRRCTGRRRDRVRELTATTNWSPTEAAAIVRLTDKLAGAGTKTTTIKTSDRYDRDEVLKALAAVDGNRSEAARRLGISRATLYRWFKELGLVASEV